MDALLFGLGLTLILAYLWYVSLIKKRNTCKEALSGIDVQLTKRASLIPNILKVAQRHVEHEQALLEEITVLRSQLKQSYNQADANQISQHLKHAELLDRKVGQLMMAIEHYPELSADATLQQAILSYNEIEEHISAARRFYNAAVTELNNAVEIFPGSIIASIANVRIQPFSRPAHRQKPKQAKLLDLVGLNVPLSRKTFSIVGGK